MLDLKGILPPNRSWRELWLPPLINGNASLPSSISGGQGLTLTGARKGSTANGVHFTGANNSNINAGAIHNNAPKLWVSFRLKPDQDFAAGASARQFPFGKWLDANNYLQMYFFETSGALRVWLWTAGVPRFTLETTITSWNAGQWYHVLFSISDTAGGIQRLLVDGGLEDSDVTATMNTPNGGDFVIGDYDDPGAGSGFEGVISDVVVGTDDLTAAEETALYNGIPPADAVNSWPLDEGRGTTAVDRGSGGNNGTLDTDASWDYDARKLVAISCDGINDNPQSPADSVDLSGDLSLIAVIQARSTYLAALTAGDKSILVAFVDNSNRINLVHENGTIITYYAQGGGVSQSVALSTVLNIGGYYIFILTLTVGGAMELFQNGVSIGTNSGVGVMSGDLGEVYIASQQTGQQETPDKHLLVGLIDGALTAAEAKTFSRFIDRQMGLGLGI